MDSLESRRQQDLVEQEGGKSRLRAELAGLATRLEDSLAGAEEAKMDADEAKKEAEEAKKEAEEANKNAEEAKKEAEEAKKVAESPWASVTKLDGPSLQRLHDAVIAEQTERPWRERLREQAERVRAEMRLEM